MSFLKYNLHGSDYVGVYATATDKFALVGYGIPPKPRRLLAEALCVEVFEVSMSGSALVGIFARANSNGIIFSNLIEDSELGQVKKLFPAMRVGRLDSGLNAVGNNILVNDRIAVINPEYSAAEEGLIRDVLGVEVMRAGIAEFKTVGANNVLTNRGFIINNRSTEREKTLLDKWVGFDSVRTTANTGSLNLGLSVVANSFGAVVGDGTTGFEINRIMEGLNIED